jgi:hypothetical protein
VVGLAWSCDPESYVGGSVAACRVSYAGGDDQTKTDTLAIVKEAKVHHGLKRPKEKKKKKCILYK